MIIYQFLNSIRTDIYLVSISSASWYLPSCLRASPALTMAIHWPESVRNDLLNNLTALSRSPKNICRSRSTIRHQASNQCLSLSIRVQRSEYNTNCDINSCPIAAQNCDKDIKTCPNVVEVLKQPF